MNTRFFFIILCMEQVLSLLFFYLAVIGDSNALSDICRVLRLIVLKLKYTNKPVVYHSHSTSSAAISSTSPVYRFNFEQKARRF